MGEQNSFSDGSWKKLVIAKANHEWISSAKAERAEIVNQTLKGDYHDFCESNVGYNEIIIKNEVADADSALTRMSEDTNANETDDTLKKRRRRGPPLRNETPEERATRLAKMSAYAAQRLSNETPEQRASRLKRMSEYAAKRLALETNDQRARRLARMSAYAARRLAEESPDQRAARLARMSAYAARRQAMKRFMNSTFPLVVSVCSDSSDLLISKSNSETSQN